MILNNDPDACLHPTLDSSHQANQHLFDIYIQYKHHILKITIEQMHTSQISFYIEST